MATRIYWLRDPAPGRLAVVARPRTAASFGQLKAAGIDVLVSLLEADEAAEVGLADAAEHCERAGIEFISMAVMDHGIPQSFEDMHAIVDYLARRRRDGLGVGAHCFAGLGRSPLLVAAILICEGLSADEAIARVSDARGVAVPEMKHQHEWLQRYAAQLAEAREGR
ncbi:MAG: dual specificity protein phosphatase family protein [Hyphomicrobiaceae bacterium]